MTVAAGDSPSYVEKYVDLPPLSEQELQQFRRTVREDTSPRFAPDGRQIFETRFPYIEDHDIALYIERLK